MEPVLLLFSLELVQFDVMHGFKLVMSNILENQTDQSSETSLLKMRLSKQASLIKVLRVKQLLVQYIKLLHQCKYISDMHRRVLNTCKVNKTSY